MRQAGMGRRDSRTRPIDLDIDRQSGQLRIRWQDGMETAVSLAAVRRQCPCATCRAARAEQSDHRLAVIAPPDDEQKLVTVSQAKLVGRYALQIIWADGHDTGIYDFELLRALGETDAGE